MSPGLIRNVRLYPVYATLFNCYFWLPVFFLYFSEHLTLARVLQLEAIYYFTVVLLEVPSGYLSDAVGRRPTMLISAGALIASYVLFFTGAGFAVFAAAQVCLAVGISFSSGTDTAFHFDSLAGLGREDEYATREAKAHRWALLATAVAALLGGLAATFQLRLAYGLSALAAIALLGVVWAMVEPPTGEGERARPHPVGQLSACLGQLRNRSLAWLFGFAVLMIVINHVPYELYQPYLDLLVSERGLDLPGEGTPLVTGIVTAMTAVIASWAAGRSIWLRDRVGLATTLLATTTLQVLIMTAMGLFLHEAVLLLVLLRSVPASLGQPPLRGAITPQVPRALRATYLSIQSLVGRLAFAGTLVLLSLGAGDHDATDWPTLSWMSRTVALYGGVAFFVLAVTARLCLPPREPAPDEVESHPQ